MPASPLLLIRTSCEIVNIFIDCGSIFPSPDTERNQCRILAIVASQAILWKQSLEILKPLLIEVWSRTTKTSDRAKTNKNNMRAYHPKSIRRNNHSDQKLTFCNYWIPTRTNTVLWRIRTAGEATPRRIYERRHPKQIRETTQRIYERHPKRSDPCGGHWSSFQVGAADRNLTTGRRESGDRSRGSPIVHPTRRYLVSCTAALTGHSDPVLRGAGDFHTTSTR